MNAQRLSKIIQTEESKKIENRLSDRINNLTFRQREDIRQMLRNYKNNK